MDWRNSVPFAELLGKTLVRAEKIGDDKLVFVTNEGVTFEQFHDQDCCESVRVEEIVGDLSDLIGSPILLADEVVHTGEDPPEVEVSEEDKRWRESWTWTFYKLSTIKGSVTIRWLGESNGYYSESVDLHRADA